MAEERTLTADEIHVLTAVRRAHPRKVHFETVRWQETACALDAKGLVAAYEDPAHSLGIIFASLTPAGRAALTASESTP
jgi:hypothetical protein